jgi:hypothetical protein
VKVPLLAVALSPVVEKVKKYKSHVAPTATKIGTKKLRTKEIQEY